MLKKLKEHLNVFFFFFKKTSLALIFLFFRNTPHTPFAVKRIKRQIPVASVFYENFLKCKSA